MVSHCLYCPGISEIVFPPKDSIDMLLTMRERRITGETELKSAEGTVILAWKVPGFVQAGREPGAEGWK